MFKQRLFTPGPTPVPEEVLLELARPMFHHRTAEYRKMLEQVTKDMQYVFGTTQEVYTITGSGSAAMEAVGRVRGGPGREDDRGARRQVRRAVERTRRGLRRQGRQPRHRVGHARHARSRSPTPSRPTPTRWPSTSRSARPRRPRSRTSQAIAKVVAQTPALLVVDGISSIGAMPFKMDEWGVDISVTGSQKALMLPAGLAFIACSEKAWKKIDATKGHAYYVSLKAYKKALAPPEWDQPYTPNNALVRAAMKALAMIRAEGLEKIWAETHKKSMAIQAAAKALGLKVYSTAPSDSVTAILVPDGDGRRGPRQDDDQGIRRQAGRRPGQAQGQGPALHDDGLHRRLGHPGGRRAPWRCRLAKMGHKVDFGAGVAAAQKVLASSRVLRAEHARHRRGCMARRATRRRDVL